MNGPITDRETLEAEALATISPDLYFDLADEIDNTPDRVLIEIINCGGDPDRELKLYSQ